MGRPQSEEEHELEPRAYPETRRPLANLGSPEPYRPNWTFEGEFINDTHRSYAELPVSGVQIVADIQGSLRVQDALKLYELAYFAGGPILELGCNRGLSTSILAKATRDAAARNPEQDFGAGPGRAATIDTVDLDQRYVDITRATLGKLGFGDRVTAHQGEASQVCRKFGELGRKFDMVFVDHAHAKDPVSSACAELLHLTNPGCFVVFHDYNDKRNRDDSAHLYGVFQGVEEGLDASVFEFYGLCGCCGVFRRKLESGVDTRGATQRAGG